MCVCVCVCVCVCLHGIDNFVPSFIYVMVRHALMNSLYRVEGCDSTLPLSGYIAAVHVQEN